MVFTRRTVEGYDALNAMLKQTKDRVIILFSGSKDGNKSWCPDCVQAESVIEKIISEMAHSNDLDLTFVECTVGFRSYWKSQTNPFRIDERFKLTEIPTLMDYNNKAKKLSGQQCAEERLVHELFLEE
ncbi:unnamed protein product [Thelazia callipaeda]|uniref:Thioredoxin domain-containing protein 17 n=1 Tax=Thelazia callipaeda TaxID=103827 RepID=A0A0N5CVI8_THECL|nr:unnamed protein product [Thelazia callipaeda]